MGVSNSEVGYTSAMPRREDHEVHKRTCGGIGGGKDYILFKTQKLAPACVVMVHIFDTLPVP